jgi:RNA polymerase sigma-70 factor (sigma-E family)
MAATTDGHEARAGRDEEFVAFAVARTPDLFRCALLLTGEWHDAEDLVQDAWATVYRHWRRVAAAGQPAAYARAVLVRAFLSRRRRRSSTELPTAEPAASGADVDPDLALRETLLAALRTLDARDRAVVVLRYWDDLDAATTGDLVGCSADAVRTRSRRALARLRTVLGDDLDHLRTD